MSADKWPGHFLVITGTEEIDREYDIECPGITDACRSWSECFAPGCQPWSEINPSGHLDAGTWDDEMFDEPTAHGVEHRRFSWGWCVPDGRCFVASYDRLADAAQDVDRGRLAPGRYPVEFDVDNETELTLRLVMPAPGGVR